MAFFSRFPPEIRRLIWTATVQPRTVPLHHHCRLEVSSAWTRYLPAHPICGCIISPSHPHLSSSAAVPAVMHVCRESRHQELYDKLFLTDGDDAAYIWVNFAIDLIDIGSQPKFGHFASCASRVRRLVCEYRRDWVNGWSLFEGLHIFDNLRTFVVVSQDGLVDYVGCYDLEGFSCKREDLYLIDKTRQKMVTYPELPHWADENYRPEDVQKLGRPVPEDLTVVGLYPSSETNDNQTGT